MQQPTLYISSNEVTQQILNYEGRKHTATHTYIGHIYLDIPLAHPAPPLGCVCVCVESAERWRTHGKPIEDLSWAFAPAASERGSVADAWIPGGTWPTPLIYIADEQAARPQWPKGNARV